MVIRTVVPLFALALYCPAQYDNGYVATDDAARLFFVSADRLAGTGQSFRSKLFSWDAKNGVRLAYEAPAEYICCVTLSGDGSLAAFRLIPADGRENRGALLHIDTGQIEPVGSSPVLSRNGRFLYHGGVLLDRNTNTSRPVPGAAFVGTDGSVLYRDLLTLHRVWPDGTDRVVMNQMRNSTLVADDENADKVIILTAPTSYLILTTTTGQQVDLTPLGPTFYPVLSGDGARVAFRSHPNALICRSDGTGCQPLTTPPSGVDPLAISKDGAAVFADSSKIIQRIDAVTGSANQAFVFSSFSPLQENPVPGSLTRFYATNPGDHITVNGLDMPLWSAPGGLPIVQIPWELPDQWVKFTMFGGASPFETFTRTYPVSDFFPQSFAPGNPALNEGNAVYREDWTPATSETPARPGEIVHIYAVGLGAVDCPVETGKPAPLDRLCRITRSVDWRWLNFSETTYPAEVLFAGLAPGMVGIYQMDVRVPDWAYGYLELSDGIHPRGFAIVFVR